MLIQPGRERRAPRLLRDGAKPRTCACSTVPRVTWVGAGFAGDPNAQVQRQMVVAGGAHDGEVLARYGNGPQCRWGANIPYDWINEHYVDARCWWAPKARCRAWCQQNAGALAVPAPAAAAR